MSCRDFEYFSGCLLGGAVGDALGAPVEFMSLTAIRKQYGPSGIQDLVNGEFTDDTQMTFFTAEGLLRAQTRYNERGICHVPSVVYHAYLRWLHTQGFESERGSNDGWLIRIPQLHQQQAPGNTCLSALQSGVMGTIEQPINNSKGCGGVMRVAPVGLLMEEGAAFRIGCEVAAITHGHPSGYLAAGVLSLLISKIINGASLQDAIDQCLRSLNGEVGHACEKAVALARRGKPSAEKVESLGAGWIAEEALAMSLYCALVYSDDLAAAVRLAVNHSGDSDSTGAITGNIVGALLGRSAIPAAWLARLQLRDAIEHIASDLLTGYQSSEAWRSRYPGW